MSSLLSQCAAAAVPMFGLPFFITNAYLTFKLRKDKKYLIYFIASKAPVKFQERALLVMESHMSWVAGSAVSYIWFSYLMIRFLWHVPHHEIVAWQLEIKTVLEKHYTVYWISTMLANLLFAGIVTFIVNEYVLPHPL